MADEYTKKEALLKSLKQGLITSISSTLAYFTLKYGLLLSNELCLGIATFIVVAIYKYFRINSNGKVS